MAFAGSDPGIGEGEHGAGEPEPILPERCRLAAYRQQQRMSIEPLQDHSAGLRQQALVGNDHEIRPIDEAALLDRPAGGAHHRMHRRPAPFRAVVRRVLHFVAGEEKGTAEDAAGRLDSLAAAAVKADAIHASLRSGRPARDARPHLIFMVGGKRHKATWPRPAPRITATV